MDFDSYERYLDFEIGVLHRISSRFYLAEWFGLRSHVEQNTDVGFICKNKMSIVWNIFTKWYIFDMAYIQRVP